MIDIMSTGFLFVWLFCCAGAIIFVGTVLYHEGKQLYRIHKYSKTIKIGDKWSINSRNNNPFMNNIVTIIDIKEDCDGILWVKYEYENGISDTESIVDFCRRHKFIK